MAIAAPPRGAASSGGGRTRPSDGSAPSPSRRTSVGLPGRRYHANAVNFVNGRGWRGLTPNGKKDFARIARSARFAMPTHEWDAAVRASSPNPVSLPSDEPLFPYDPSEVYEKDATEVETDALYYLT